MTYKRFFFTACLIFVFLFTSSLFSQTSAVDNSPTTVIKSKNENNTIKIGKHIESESEKDVRVVDPWRVNISNYNDSGSEDIAKSLMNRTINTNNKTEFSQSVATKTGDLVEPRRISPSTYLSSSKHSGYVPEGSRVAPTVVDIIDLSGLSIYCWGLTYDWDRDALWVTQYNNATMYLIDKTSPLNILGSVTISGIAPPYYVGIAYAGSDILYMLDYTGGNIYQINVSTGAGSFYRTQPWVQGEGLGWSVADDAAYPGDWGADQCAYAIPSLTGGWNLWARPDVSGLAASYDAATSPSWLFVVDENAAQAYLYQYTLTAGVPSGAPFVTWDLPAGMTQSLTADCAYDGQYVYVLDQATEDSIWVLDVTILTTDAEVLSIDYPNIDCFVMTPGVAVTVQATVRNNGTGSETFNVLCEVDSAGTIIYSDIESVTLNSMQSTQVSFLPQWNAPVEDVNYYVTVTTQLADDEDPSNDSKTTRAKAVTWTDEISYDDGTMANAWYFVDPNYDSIIAKMCEPPSYPCFLKYAAVYLLSDTDPFWPWPDATHDPVELTVWVDTDGDNVPDNLVFRDTVCGDAIAPSWVYVVPIDTVQISNYNLWIGFNNLPGGGSEGIGMDAVTDFPSNKYVYSGGNWHIQNRYDGDDMIRAYVSTISFDYDVGVVSIDAPPVSILPSTTLDPTATFKNYGIFDETFDVYFDIDTNGALFYTDTRNITVSSGAESTVAFNSCTFGDISFFTYDITVYTVLGGDEFPGNDTLTQQTIIDPTFWEILDPPLMPVGSSGHSMASGHDGFIYVSGINTGIITNEMYIYDINADTWASGPNAPTASTYGTASYCNGMFYKIGGTNAWPTPLTAVDIYDPAGGTWSSGTPSPTGLLDHCAGVYKDSLIFTFGNGNWGMAPTNEVYIYDTYNDAWTAATPFPGLARGTCAGGVIDSFAIIACGYLSTGAYGDDYIVGIIDPSNPANITWGSWAAIPVMGGAGRYRVPSGVDEISEPANERELYVICGQNGPFVDTYSYNPFTDTWTDWAAPKPAPVGNVTPIAITTTLLGDIGVFVSGGFNGSYIGDNEVFHTGKLAAPLLANNVGTQAINNPGTSILINETINPEATFRNYGAMPATFGIFFEIEESGIPVYNDNGTLTLNPGESSIFVFPSTWTSGPIPGIVYDVTVYTVLLGDMDTSNDTLIRQTITTNLTDWIRCADRPTAEECHATCYDPVGDRIYNFGGTRAGGLGGYYSWTYQYDPVTDTWAPMAPMPSSIDWIDASVIQWNRSIYIFGGFDGSVYNYNYIYDINSNSWTSGANMPIARFAAGQVIYNDSLIYMLGGYDDVVSTDNVQIYNTYTDSWTNGTNLPLPFRMGGVAILGNTIWLVGGYDNALAYSTLYYGVINPANCETITWSVGDLLAVPNFNNGATQMVRDGNSYLYMVGGFENAVFPPTNHAWEYGFAKGTWTALPNYPMTITRNDFLVARDGATYPEIYVCGGDNTGNWTETNQVWKLRWAALVAIELSSFTADYKNGEVMLQWKTECEENNALWRIDRKEGKEDWKTVTTIPSEGNSPCGYFYEYSDNDVLENRRYTYRLGDIDTEGKLTWRMAITVFTHDINAPKVFGLAQNYPNPFVDRTTIKYQVPVKTKVEIDIYDVSGRHIKRIVNEVQEPGYYRAIWDGTNKNNRAAGMGMYFCRMSTDNYTKTRRLIRF